MGIWRQHWSGVEAVVVKIAEDSIVLEAISSDGSVTLSSAAFAAIGNVSTDGADGAGEAPPETPKPSPESGPEAEGLPREQGRVKWFDSDKGYGFLVRPTGDDLFVHHSEVQGDPSELSPSGEVEYEVGHNDRGPNARSVRTIG